MTETTDTATTEGVASIAEMLLSLARPAGPTTDEPDGADEATAAAEAARAAIEAERAASRAAGRVHHESIEWGGQVESFSRKRIAFLRALRSHRIVVGRTDGPSDPAPIAAAIARHVRAVDALGIDGLDGDDWWLVWAVPGRGRWDDPTLVTWARDAVAHESRLQEYRDEAEQLRSIAVTVRAHERVGARCATYAGRNSALRSELRSSLGPVIDDVAGPTAPAVSDDTVEASAPVVSAGRKRPARKAATAS